MELKLYKRPFACLTVGGGRARMTPSVLSRFSSALAAKKINTEFISSGEYSLCFFVDEKDFAKGKAAFADVLRKTAFESLQTGKSIAGMTASGKELVQSPGMLTEIIKPLSSGKIDILTITSSPDSIAIFVDWNARKKAFRLLATAFKKSKIR